MLLSMTGFGEGHCQQDGKAIVVEVRTINSRYFKLSVRAPEGYAALEPRLETVVREQIRRGTVQVNLRIDQVASADDFRINELVLAGYRRQLQAVSEKLGDQGSISLELLLNLPGVVDEQSARHVDVEADWPLIETAVREALEHLAQMRVQEGRAMADDLSQQCQSIAVQLDAIEERAPLVVNAYAQRLTDRLTRLLHDHEVKVETADIVREVGIFAERSDIAEEIVRLKSHLVQYRKTMQDGESVGRKLEFITQEMFRETNTIGSKGNDSEIAQHVVEIKTAIERMREMIQNVE